MSCEKSFFRRCKFQPRYDEKGIDPEKLGGVKFTLAIDESLEGVLKTFVTKTYVGDMCVRCGKFVKKEA